MYNYASTDSIFDGVSNIYLVSIATAFLAVIVALYYSNFLKDDNINQNKACLTEGDEEELVDDIQAEGYVESDESEIENHYFPKEQRRDGRLVQDDYDECNSDEYDDDDEDMHADGLVSKLKSKRVKELEARLSRDQLEEERRIEREQLAAIFELLKKQEAELNMKEIDETELNAQLGLYR